MIKNRIISLLCLAVFTFCMVYAQTSGKWIKFYENEKCFFFYRSDIKTDRDNNHYVWTKCTITSPKERMKIANDLNSSTPVHNVMFQIEYDSDYELGKLVQIRALSNSGKVLIEAKSETLGKWNVVDEDDMFLQTLSKQLRGRSGRVYIEPNRRSDKVYTETNSQSDKVYEKLLNKIREKQIKQEEKSRNQEELWDDVLEDEEQKQAKQAIEEQKVFDVVEEMPQFPGGPSALFEYLSKSIKYPINAEENGVQGRVIVTFIIERDGSITNVKVVKSVEPSLDQEAIRVVESMPYWIPGKQGGKPVRVKYTVPVTFKLQ